MDIPSSPRKEHLLSQSIDLTQHMAAYDALAVELLSMTTPNTSDGFAFSNVQLSGLICALMKWEDFDLLGTYNFAEVFVTGSKESVQALCFIAYLRLHLFRNAIRREVGPEKYNVFAAAVHEYWHKKLLDKFYSLLHDRPVTHEWLN